MRSAETPGRLSFDPQMMPAFRRGKAERRLLSVLLLSGAALLTACHGSKSPTEPTTPTAVVRILGENHFPSPIGLQHRLYGGGLHPLVTVPPGAAVEFYRWSDAGAVINAPFVVLRQSPSNPAEYFAWADVYYSFSLPDSSQTDVRIVISLTLDATGLLAATSSRPDLLQIVRISYYPGTPSHAR